jgi:glycosyltransferase involved in cell wall biosynthesis
MRVEAVSTCVGYGDFLAVTLPYNMQLFDHIVIVTTPQDDATREVCRRLGVTCILTEEFYRDGHFNKARGINKGLDQLSHTEFVCHLDADVILPDHFRAALRMAHPSPADLYGCDRVMVRRWADWVRLRDSGYLQHDYHCRINFPDGWALKQPFGFQVGSRWANSEHGYCPIGFFQLWHSRSDIYRGVHLRHYPTTCNDAARSDVQFAIRWDRRQRQLLPEIIAVHLESEPAPLGANWRGRTTKKFGPSN